MKIVVLDGYTLNPGDLSWEELEQYGELTVYDRTAPDDEREIVQRIQDAEVVFTNKTPLSKNVFNSCGNIKYVGVLATGYNVVDILSAKERGIVVTNIPTYGTNAVGQFAIALLLEICHRIGHHDKAVHEGAWETNKDWCFWDYPLIELAGKTMGIIGFGKIGQTTGRIARALGMEVIANDEYPNDRGREIAEYVSKDEVFKKADVITLHCPLFASTEGIICKKNIEKMKDGVIILNNSRGALIVEQDLAEALNSGKIYAAGLDVVSTEPIKKDNPLLKAKNCILTPHMSWGAKESRQRLMKTAVENLKGFLEGMPINVVAS
ncbi:D-2-hydroxyacid dehydrogenase [Mediterraneibacter sp. NSJ-55]|uniref:D-2-hydroxyacid dehydrogenase n=1 Tax=Mediterraneibacter hominis TaxID=2763054 RepID=A0A923RQJ9_9FIRM|nr:D-2-hydroxyacid dehydrogenase [Mediterraneibacter hominis]MBC5689610.1 D-2-hydroxyacid dehydrogenase [Mediterraneibacter hominis]